MNKAIVMYLAVLKVRNIVVTVLLLLTSSLSFAFFWLLSIMLYELGSVELVGITYTVAMAIPIFVAPLAGGLTDRYGRKIVMVLSNLFSVVAFGILVLNLSIYTLISAIMITRISTVLSFPALFSLIAESVREEERGYAFAITALMPYLSGGIGSLALGLLAERAIHTAVVVTFLLSVISFFITFLFKETLTRKVVEGEGGESILKALMSLKELRKLGVIYIYLAVLTVMGEFGSRLFGVYTPLYLTELGLSKGEIGVVYGTFNLAAAVFTPIAGVIVATLGGFRSLQLSILFAATAIILMSLLPSKALLLAAILLTISTAASSINQVASNVFVAGLTSSEVRSTLVGSLMPLAQLGSIIAPAVGAVIFSQNPRIVPLVIGGVFLLSFLLLTQMGRKLKKNETLKS